MNCALYVASFCCKCVLVLLCVSSYYYICVLILLYMCRHTAIYALIAEADLILLYVCPHTTIVCVHILRHVSSYYYICPHSTKCVSTYYCICVLILIYTIYMSCRRQMDCRRQTLKLKKRYMFVHILICTVQMSCAAGK